MNKIKNVTKKNDTKKVRNIIKEKNNTEKEKNITKKAKSSLKKAKTNQKITTKKEKNIKKKQSDNKKIKDNKVAKKINYQDLTVAQIEKELKRETYKSKYIKILMSTIYSLIIVASISALVATLVMPVLQISGSSMTPTFHEGEIVISVKTKNLKAGDIIAFYHGNKILVKRVIAGAGNWVNISEEGNVYINGEILNEPYIDEHFLGDHDIEFPYQVPDGHWFVLGDHRTISIDSRNSEIGSIQQDDIVGKIIFRVWPLKDFGKVE